MRLTNVRYADDLMLYARSLGELVRMIEVLVDELAALGLQLNATKTKIFTTDRLQTQLSVDIAGDFVEVMVGLASHKYLGHKVPGSLRDRSRVELAHRVQAAWLKFHEHRDVLTDRNISVRLRLKLFDATVSPTVLFGLATVPLSQNQLEYLGALQRRMLRLIVGWVRLRDEPWDETMRRMRDRVSRALVLFPVETWPKKHLRHKYRYVGRVLQKAGDLPARVLNWDPTSTDETARRPPGRPALRWDDDLMPFAAERFPGRPWFHVAANPAEWNAEEHSFLAKFNK